MVYTNTHIQTPFSATTTTLVATATVLVQVQRAPKGTASPLVAHASWQRGEGGPLNVRGANN